MTQIVELVRDIGDIISHGEGNYESYNSGTKGVLGGRVGHSFVNRPAGTVTGKTIAQILATDGIVGGGKNPNRMFATGKYQTTIPTLKRAVAALNLTGDELYDAENQERVFREFLLFKAGGGALARFVFDGRGTIDDAQYAVSKEWASIGVPVGRTDIAGNASNGYRSFYHGPANAANRRSTDSLRAKLQDIAVQRPPGGWG